MSMYCGNCRELIFVSTSRDWYTNKDNLKVESGCDSCGHGMHKLNQLWGAISKIGEKI